MTNENESDSNQTGSEEQNYLQAEARVLRRIGTRDYADPLSNQDIVDFIDNVGAQRDPEYALRLADAVLADLKLTGDDPSEFGIQVLLSSATTHWLTGDADTAERILNTLVDSEALDPEQLVRGTSLLARIAGAQGRCNEAAEFLISIIPRLVRGTETKTKAALCASQYLNLNRNYSSALKLIESIQREIIDSGAVISVETEQLLGIELAWTHFNLGDTIKAIELLESPAMDVNGDENPRLQNFKAYVYAWTDAVQSSRRLGDAIRDGKYKFVYNPLITDSQHMIGGAWSMVQEGNILGAHNLFRAAAMERKPDHPAHVVLNSVESALEGVAFTAKELDREELALEALTELQELQSLGGFFVSVSGIFHGMDLVLNSQAEVHARLAVIRSIRRRGQVTQGNASLLVLRCSLTECELLHEAGLFQQELELRTYCRKLMASTRRVKTRLGYENEVRIASLTAKFGDVAGAQAFIEQVLPEILSLYGAADELTINARFARAAILEGSAPDDTILDELRSLQLDVERIFGVNSIMNLRAQYRTACSLDAAGEREEALSVLLAVEGNRGFNSAGQEFGSTVVSKVADLFFEIGNYSRAVKWYKLIASRSFDSPDELSQHDYRMQIMYGCALAKAGKFKEARSHLAVILDQSVSQEPENFEISLMGKIASAACAESLGTYTKAAFEYQEIVTRINEKSNESELMLWDLNISVARNYEMADDQPNAFLYYEEALRLANILGDIDAVLIQEISWRRDCCRP
ncbi:hypothetical protein ART_1246 [Arthrobacter sp. PAMC 25486]|uniref:hypothetical protein n=1 Tax=Arthrobacter sp. PAMC 25486 TaxID=1494608 RepID=UPI0005363D72|nr:hypothetical protein [Arthrobacter sp. PAMC 25486]AIY00845.1 hypothetical protein ART_1246 [Arthrobacter sp. PAMC 25486]